MGMTAWWGMVGGWWKYGHKVEVIGRGRRLAALGLLLPFLHPERGQKEFTIFCRLLWDSSPQAVEKSPEIVFFCGILSGVAGCI